jgi:protein-disulfide isomerase
MITIAGTVLADECVPFSPDVRGRIAAYAALKYDLAPDLRVEGGETLPNSCFRRLIIQAASPKRLLELFLSPDQRFLAESLLDTSIDPALERRRAAAVVNADLLAGPAPSHGPKSAPVTVVEFSDFQCPFCKRAADALANLPEDMRNDVRVVFKQRPLAMHQWARRAALTSICASLQGEDVFWALGAFLFSNQDLISADALETKIREFASNDSRLDLARLNSCLAAKDADGVLSRDEGLAQQYHVDAAPTLFINGVRRVGVGSPEELWSALRAAAIEARRSGPGCLQCDH